MEGIKYDIQQSEQDIDKIKCEPIITFFKYLFKCIQDAFYHTFINQRPNFVFPSFEYYFLFI